MTTTNEVMLAAKLASKMGLKFSSRLNQAMVMAPKGMSRKLKACTRMTSCTPGER